MNDNNKVIYKYRVWYAPDKYKNFTEEQWEDAREFAKEHNSYVRLI